VLVVLVRRLASGRGPGGTVAAICPCIGSPSRATRPPAPTPNGAAPKARPTAWSDAVSSATSSASSTAKLETEPATTPAW